MMNCHSRCMFLNLAAPLVLLSTSAIHAQPKELPEVVFAAALDTARKYADDRTLINFCLRTNGEVRPFLYLGLHDDLEQTRQRMKSAGGSQVQIAIVLQTVLSTVRHSARDAKDSRLEQECAQRNVATGYMILLPESGATPLFMRAPFDAMKP